MSEGLMTINVQPLHIQCITEKPLSLAFCYTAFRASCSKKVHSIVNFTGSFAFRKCISDNYTDEKTSW